MVAVRLCKCNFVKKVQIQIKRGYLLVVSYMHTLCIYTYFDGFTRFNWIACSFGQAFEYFATEDVFRNQGKIEICMIMNVHTSCKNSSILVC